MKLDFALLEKLVKSGAPDEMIANTVREIVARKLDDKTASAFLQFRAAYPKRDGPNPWRPAEQRFNGLVKAGIDPGAIIAAAIKFAREEAARGTVGTRFIPHAVTWLNQHRFAETEPVYAVKPIEMNWDQICDSYIRFKRWSKWAGPDPESPACRCPKDVLVRHGIVTI